MERWEKVIFTNMCMVYDGTKVLVQDKVDPDWPGVTFPGGHVEQGESFADAVVREVYEETGLRITSPVLCGVKDWMQEDGSRYMVLLYKCSRFEGELRSSDEGSVFWAELQEMRHMCMASGMENMLKVFLSDDLSEDFFCKENDRWIEALK